MANLTELMAQKAELDRQIAAAKAEAVEGIKAQMALFGVTVEDLGGAPPAPARASTTGQKRPIKYRDEKGNTWTGIGQRPRWLRDALLAGASLEQFALRKTAP